MLLIVGARLRSQRSQVLRLLMHLTEQHFLVCARNIGRRDRVELLCGWCWLDLLGRGCISSLVVAVLDGAAPRGQSLVLFVCCIRIDGRQGTCLLRLFDYLGKVSFSFYNTHLIHTLV